MNCPFCDIKIENTVFARSEKFLAIYNIAPILPGHSLIIPKSHIQSAMEFSDADLAEMILFTRNVTDLLLTTFNAEAFNWSIQEKEAAGQSVSHLHLHIVPRYRGDLPDPGDWYPRIESSYEKILDSENRIKLSDEELWKIVGKLRQAAMERKLYAVS